MLSPADSPFPGLRSFEPEEALLFFGREAQVEELLRRLGADRFLAIVGTSGCGKSSLVKAGLLPSLQRGYLWGATSRWRLALMRPGPDPVRALAAAISRCLGANDAVWIDDAHKTIDATTSGLARVIQDSGVSAGESVLIVVDQFEEIFRYGSEGDKGTTVADAAHFVAALLHAVEQVAVPIYVVLTMRSDFLGDCAQFPGLPEALNRSQYLVPRLTREQRRDAIVRPLLLVGAVPSEALVQAVLNDVGDDPDQLPVLQHALLRTYRRWQKGGSGGEVTLQHYVAAGGVSAALNAHADEVLVSVGDENGPLTERIFRTLVTTQGGRMVRRPRDLSSLYAIVGADDPSSKGRVDLVVGTFANREHSLLMLSSVPLTPAAVVDIAHESLIRRWDSLRRWAQDEEKSADWFADLALSVLRRKNNEGHLWKDPELAHVLLRSRKERWNAAWAEQYCAAEKVPFADVEAFLADSSREQEDERQRTAAQHEKELKDAQKLAAARTWLARVLVILLITVVVFVGLFSWWDSRHRQEVQRLNEQFLVAQAKEREAQQRSMDLAARASDLEARARAATGAERERIEAELRATQEKYDKSVVATQELRESVSRLQAQQQTKGTDSSALLERITELQRDNKSVQDQLGVVTRERDQLRGAMQSAPASAVNIWRDRAVKAETELGRRKRPVTYVVAPQNSLTRPASPLSSIAIGIGDVPESKNSDVRVLIWTANLPPLFKADRTLATKTFGQGACSGRVNPDLWCFVVRRSQVMAGAQLLDDIQIGDTVFSISVVAWHSDAIGTEEALTLAFVVAEK